VSSALLVPIHLDAFFVESEETVLHSMADFSKLPYFDGERNQNSDTAYTSEAIVSQAFRDKDLRLKKGVHLHWALPDALTQGTNTKQGLVFPAAPDRWLVTRTGPEGGQAQWIVESDYIYPVDKELSEEIKIIASLKEPDAGKRQRLEKKYTSALQDVLEDTVTFPLPPEPSSSNQQPYRYLGRKRDLNQAHSKELDNKYLNQLAYPSGKKNAWHKMLESGLTAMGYGEPAFAAFYPNCRSVFGLHDPDISERDFKQCTYEVIGWYDAPTKRDCLQCKPYEGAKIAIKERFRKEFLASGMKITPANEKLKSMGSQIDSEALSHHFAWQVHHNWNNSTQQWEEVLSEQVDVSSLSRFFCHAKLTAVTNEVSNESDAVDVAIGNTASEALSAYLGDAIEGDTSLIEEQLEALDLGKKLAHHQLDLGPKLQEARHNKGFRAVGAGVLWTVRLERDPAHSESSDTIHAVSDRSPPIYIAHLLNELNQLQNKYEQAKQEMASLRREIYHDWTLYMRSLRPPEGLSDGYPDPVEIAKFIDRAGLTSLKRMQAANGRFKFDAEQRSEQEVRSAPIISKPASEYADEKSVAAKISKQIDHLHEAFKGANGLHLSLRLMDNFISAIKTDESKSAALNAKLIAFIEGYGHAKVLTGQSLESSRKQIHNAVDSLTDTLAASAFSENFAQVLLTSTQGKMGKSNEVRMRYVLRQLDAPRYYRPTDPVVLLTGDKIKPTDRHGTDGQDNADGKLDCRMIAGQDIDVPSISKWEINDDGIIQLPSQLSHIKTAIFNIPPNGKIGCRHRQSQPWHPFMMEWQVEMTPTSTGSNRDKFRQTYANTFVTDNFNLPETAVDLKLSSDLATSSRTADTGIYSGQCILIDQAADTLKFKLNDYLTANDLTTVEADKEKPVAHTLTKQKTIANLGQAKALLDDKPYTLSQSLDGLHQALLQRHQILQLPIKDPIGFKDLQPLTEAVQKATQGRHTSSPMRDRDFTPIRSGQMKLRQLRIIDTFGRVMPIISEDKISRIVRSESLRSLNDSQSIHLAPRLVQAARINFRWLSAEHANGTNMDEPEANSHPAYTPVCGWLMPNNRDNTIEVFSHQGDALGTVVQQGERMVWRKPPGSTSRHWRIDDPKTIINHHLRKWLATIVDQLGAKDNDFFEHFMAALGNALETIAPESFKHHQGKALLIGRPIALVRAMVDLELMGRPAVNQSSAVFARDLQRAVDPQPDQKSVKPRRAQFTLAKTEHEDFLAALNKLDAQGIRHAFNTRELDLPDDNEDIHIRLIEQAEDQTRWQIQLPTNKYVVRLENGRIVVYAETERSSDDFTHVRFPIRIGEYQQLNDGLLGYFIEQEDGEDYHYKDNCFYAPQSGARTPLSLNSPENKLQQWVDELNQSKLPAGIAQQLNINSRPVVTVDKTGHQWRIDSEHHVFNIVREVTGLALFEILDSSSEHIKTHYKTPINIQQSIDDAPQKLTMLVDPQGSVHAVSGILPTKSINIPEDQYADALSKLEITFASRPILTEEGKIKLPLRAEQGYQWSWLSKNGDLWTENSDIEKMDTLAHFHRQQNLLEGYLKLKKTNN
jgi:hypothetical protein